MKLLTKEILQRVPALYATENVKAGEKIVHAKFFNAWGAGTWYMVEYNPSTQIAFGFADIGYGEWGYFSMAELQSTPQIERDIHFSPKAWREVPGAKYY